MPQIINYSPQSVLLPLERKLARKPQISKIFNKSIRLHEKEQQFYDAKTLFYDIFLAKDQQKLYCLGPPFLNLGAPQKIYQNQTPLKFVIRRGSYWFNNQVLALVEIELPNGQSPIELKFEFMHFDINLSWTNQPIPQLDKVPLSLVTLQKNNPIVWIMDWVNWYTKIHGIDRIIIYDNHSSNFANLQKSFADLNVNCQIILIDWPFPYGPATNHKLKYAQIGCFNHFRLLFGNTTNWCIQLDIDEYLSPPNNRSIHHYLDKKSSHCAIYLDSYLIPRKKIAGLIRFFHHTTRPYWSRLWAGKKYIYHPDRIQLNLIHRAIPKSLSLLHLNYGIQKRWDIMYKFFISLLKRKSRQQEKPFFFYHFRSLGTGWKVSQLRSHQAVNKISVKKLVSLTPRKKYPTMVEVDDTRIQDAAAEAGIIKL